MWRISGERAEQRRFLVGAVCMIALRRPVDGRKLEWPSTGKDLVICPDF